MRRRDTCRLRCCDEDYEYNGKSQHWTLRQSFRQLFLFLSHLGTHPVPLAMPAASVSRPAPATLLTRLKTEGATSAVAGPKSSPPRGTAAASASQGGASKQEGEKRCQNGRDEEQFGDEFRRKNNEGARKDIPSARKGTHGRASVAMIAYYMIR